MHPRLKPFLVMAFTALFAFPSNVEALEGCPTFTETQWVEDVDSFSQYIKAIHPEPFWAVQESVFDQRGANLKASLGDLNGCQIVVEIFKINALLQDGHSTPLIETVPGIENTYFFPAAFYDFTDGIYVLGAEESLPSLPGTRILSIGGVPIDEAWDRIIKATRGDNIQTQRSIGKYRLQDPVFVFGSGLTSSPDHMTLEVETPTGKVKTITIKALTIDQVETFGWVWARPLVGPNGPMAFRDRAEEIGDGPKGWDYLVFPDKYWFAYIDDIDALYVKMNSVSHKPDYNFDAFTKDVFEYIDDHKVSRLIIDISRNGGGNGTIVLPFLHEVIKRDDINQRGHLFTVIGRNTFSAAQIFAGFLKRHTNTLFVGEPTGGNQIHYGEANPVTLPNSGLKVVISTNMYQNTWPWDSRGRMPIFPDISAEFSGSDFFNNRDVVMESIRNFIEKPWLPLNETLAPYLEKGEFEKAKGVFLQYRQDHPDRYGVSIESELNRLGYSLMAQGNIDEAIAVFEMNTLAYPGSANVWDSLGEAWLSKGDKKEALQFYKKTLALNPQNSNAEKIIKELEKDNTP